MSQPVSEPFASQGMTLLRRVQRIRRMATKELKEILRDRRTLVTLVLMPFLLYPLFSLILRKFLFVGGTDGRPLVYAVACGSAEEASVFQWMIERGRPLVERRTPGQPVPQVNVAVFNTPGETPEDALLAGKVDVVAKITKFPQNQAQPNAFWELDVDLLAVEGSLLGERATRIVDDCARAVGTIVWAERLKSLGIRQRPTPVRATRRIVKNPQPSSAVSLSSLIPFVLIMMTITGAVYPAIDLTAGERERGTLELLIAAPVPRLGLLFAKYLAVVTVAMLTATINLVAMTTTIFFSGLGTMVWGQQGLSWGTVAAVFGLLFLMATFFSAVLLTITSFARSFKEAQAYLIPVMLCALGPGLISLMPGVELQGWRLVTPLLNAALLSRDLLAGEGSLLSAIVVVISTSLYSFAALAMAAKLFAAEGVLFDARIGWGDLWQRPTRSSAASIAQSLLCLACMFPVSFAALGGISQLQDTSLSFRFGLVAFATATIYGGVPLIFAYWQRVAWDTGLSWRIPHWTSWVGAVVLGLSLWPLAHEIVVISQAMGLSSLEQEQLDKARGLIEQARQVPLWLFLMAIALAPACFEEFCFRGYVFGAFRARLRPAIAILVTGLLFGAFHLVTSDALAVERFLPSTALGCVLGWTCWRSGSVFPGMLLHATHNGWLALTIYYLPVIKSLGWGMEEREHLPITWLVAAACGCLMGAWIVSKGRDPSRFRTSYLPA